LTLYTLHFTSPFNVLLFGFNPPPPFVGHGWPTKTEFSVKVLQYPESLSHGPVTGILWFSLIIIIISPSQHLNFFNIAFEKEQVEFYFRLSLCLFLSRSLDCLELLSNSHLSVFGH
jgi:hypothetical protein